MNFIGDFQILFPCRGAAIDLSPAFQRREWRHLDFPVAERRLTEGSQEQSDRPLIIRRDRSPFLPVNRRSATTGNYHAQPGVETPG
jgi:hypothetical protein